MNCPARNGSGSFSFIYKMANIVELRDMVRKLRDNFEDIARDTIIEDGDVIVELQKDQLMHGENMLGESIEPEYASFSYAKFKNRINPRAGFGTPDLRFTGAFYDAFFLDDDDLEVYSRDPKVEILIAKYGGYIFGLNEDSIERYRHCFREKLKGKVDAIMRGE